MKHLERFLPCILDQDYPEFEVVIVNDRSTDGSQEWLADYAKWNSKLRVIHSTDDLLPGKRTALRKGIESSKYDLLLLTDADCQPASRQWLKLMVESLTEKSEIVLGFSPCFKRDGMLNSFIRYENFLTGLYYLSFANAKMPYMGAGRNLLYRKSVTTKIGALEHHSGLLSGDDDLTVNRIATNRNTALMIHPQAHVLTIPPATFREFIHQKRRHYSTGFYYQPRHKIILGTLYASQIIFNLAAVSLFLSGFLLLPAVSIFIIKNILQTVIYGRVMRRLNVHNLWIFTPVFDLCVSAFFLTLGGLSLFKPKTWKQQNA